MQKVESGCCECEHETAASECYISIVRRHSTVGVKIVAHNKILCSAPALHRVAKWMTKKKDLLSYCT